jgi:hypothetical protein
MSGAKLLLPYTLSWRRTFSKVITLDLDGQTPKHKNVAGWNRLRGRFSKLFRKRGD